MDTGFFIKSNHTEFGVSWALNCSKFCLLQLLLELFWSPWSLCRTSWGWERFPNASNTTSPEGTGVLHLCIWLNGDLEDPCWTSFSPESIEEHAEFSHLWKIFWGSAAFIQPSLEVLEKYFHFSRSPDPHWAKSKDLKSTGKKTQIVFAFLRHAENFTLIRMFVDEKLLCS